MCILVSREVKKSEIALEKIRSCAYGTTDKLRPITRPINSRKIRQIQLGPVVAIQIPHLIQSNDAFGHKKPTRAFNLQNSNTSGQTKKGPLNNYGSVQTMV